MNSIVLTLIPPFKSIDQHLKQFSKVLMGCIAVIACQNKRLGHNCGGHKSTKCKAAAFILKIEIIVGYVLQDVMLLFYVVLCGWLENSTASTSERYCGTSLHGVKEGREGSWCMEVIGGQLGGVFEAVFRCFKALYIFFRLCRVVATLEKLDNSCRCFLVDAGKG